MGTDTRYWSERSAAAYNSLLSHGRVPELERRSYIDFVREDRAYAGSARSARTRPSGSGSSLHAEPLPFTARKHALTDNVLKTDRCTLHLNKLIYNAFLRTCAEGGVTPSQLLLAVLAAYLQRVTGRDDIVVGTPILNRSNHAFRETAGMFMNMMPLRIAIAKGSTVLGLARQIAAEVRSCYRHQRFPVGEIVRHCRRVDGLSRHLQRHICLSQAGL